MILHHDIARLVIINCEEATWKSSEALTDTPYNPPLKTQPHFPAPVSLEAKEITCSTIRAGKICCKLICIMCVDCPHNSAPWFLWRGSTTVSAFLPIDWDGAQDWRHQQQCLSLCIVHDHESLNRVLSMQGIYLLAAKTTHQRNKLCCLEKVMMANRFLISASH